MKKSTVIIRINASDLRALKKIFPAERKESIAHYMKRYITELKKQETGYTKKDMKLFEKINTAKAMSKAKLAENIARRLK